jgi:hypothetical protein
MIETPFSLSVGGIRWVMMYFEPGPEKVTEDLPPSYRIGLFWAF